MTPKEIEVLTKVASILDECHINDLSRETDAITADAARDFIFNSAIDVDLDLQDENPRGKG